MAISYEPPRGDVVAALNFYSPPEDGSAPYNLAGDHPPGLPLRNFGSVAHDVLIRDIRGKESSFNLDNDAFQIIQNLPPSAEPSFTDDESIQKNYYPEVERLLLDTVPGAFKVVIFDHTIRRPNGKRQPVPRVHIDQTARSVAQRVRRHASSPEEAEHLLSSSRYRIINVWRPLNKGPVESNPLAFASSSTLRDEDVVPVEHRYPAEVGYVGQTAAIRYHPDQKWYYLSGMTGDERILLECFDSEGLKEGSAVKGGRVAHTAFDDPRTREGAEGRESIEVRALVFGS
ncbi:hypothetical protein MYCTH_2312287 [Thermothelomyces thermophilus ATCC 42464]|uniref:Methyltransferase-like protein n=1 Tax=Thermothelomyces thermophilus (strain ATCC 42464 / BCRC 31852 / DSM 1799) TaxID=573729 RepID=G2QQ94_THET4|nr:uncharacterized protein MYCTH_2312287 [Thermothelomyces thermophilus ATCC 42464]AEO61757.1 hypothetical protein MYCTH_2312287 [Thermothelomyces thermophilus ATCC 42464]